MIVKNKDKSKIPKGDYCYDEKGPCLYWSCRKDLSEQENGCCSFLGINDFEENSKIEVYDTKKKEVIWEHPILSLLWDQVKECSVNYYTDKEWDQMIKDKKVVVHKYKMEKKYVHRGI